MVYYHNEISNVLYEIKNDKKKKKTNKKTQVLNIKMY